MVLRARELEFEVITEEIVDRLAPGLSALHAAVRGEQHPPAYWRWCYLDAPAGGAASVVAHRNGEVVGKLGCVLVPVSVQGERRVAVVLEGLSVRSEERSWHCLQGLLERSIDVVAATQADFAFGFSTRRAAVMNRALGATTLGRVPIFTGVVRASRALGARGVPWPATSLVGRTLQPLLGLRRRRARGLGELRVGPLQWVSAEVDALWAAVAPRRRISVVKDASYQTWRYRGCPGRRHEAVEARRHGRLVGLVQVRVDPPRGEVYLLDILAIDDDPAVLSALVSAVVSLAADRGAALIRAAFPTASAEAAALRSAGFLTWATPLWGMQLTVVTERGADSPELRGGAWHYSLGDWLYH